MIGRLIGNYRVAAKIGEGGMGVVYLAEHPDIGRKLVVKVLHPHLVSDPQNRSRFLNEARAAAAIRHPNIVDVIDVGTLSPEGTPYIVMEHLVGEDLSARLHRRRQLTIPEAIDITHQTAAALGAAHARGIIHRDLKPANLFVIADDAHPGHERIKVLDFGVAKLQGAIAGAVRTQSGVFLGTPTYMSPEQCLGNREIDHRADLYSLGVILYEMVCGAPPFVSSGMGELVLMHTGHAPAAPRSHNAAIPEALEHVIARLLAKAPDQRFASAAELQAALAAIAPRAGSPSWAAAPPGSLASPGSWAPAAPMPPQGSHAYAATPPAPTPPGERASPTEGSPGATRAMHYSVIAAPPVADKPVARRSRAGLWGFIAGASLAAVAAVLFVVSRSPTTPPAGDAAIADGHLADATVEAAQPDDGKPHPIDAGRHPHPVDAPVSHAIDAAPPRHADAAVTLPPPPVDAAPPHDAASPPADASAPPPPDAAVPPSIDAGHPPPDARPPADAGPHPIDAERPPPDARPLPIDAGPSPDAGSAPPNIAEACARSCRKQRSCGLRPGASCEQSCTSTPTVSACALVAADDCDAAASCDLVGECGGIGPTGTTTCNATFACELRCGSQAGCACHCTQQLAPKHASAWLKLQRCVSGCRRDPACVQRSCRRFILACQAE